MEARHGEKSRRNSWACGSRRLGRGRAEQWGDEPAWQEWSQVLKVFHCLLGNLSKNQSLMKRRNYFGFMADSTSCCYNSEILGKEANLAVLSVYSPVQ